MRTSQRRLTRALAVAVATDEFPRSGVYGGKTLTPRKGSSAWPHWS
jgi:hypothetical protein